MASIIPNLEHQSDRSSRESKRKKRRKIDTSLTNQFTSGATTNPQFKWRSPTEQQTYSSKLVEAVRHVRRNNNDDASSSAPPPAVRGRAVREIADKILAIAARGRTRWSRAILKDRHKLRLRSHKKAKPAKSRLAAPTGNSRLKSRETDAMAKMVPPLHRRVRVLGRLVPGCRKLSFPNLLEETSDYVAALQMQVQAMTKIAERLAGAQAEFSSRRERS